MEEDASTSVLLRNPKDGRFSKVPFTSVLWNTKDYPFPKDLGLVKENIVKALSDKDGYCKNLFWIVSAYGDEINKMESEILFKARIFYKGYASHDLPIDIQILKECVSLYHRTFHFNQRLNLVVISKGVHEYEFQRVLRALKTRGVNVLSVEPQAHISSDTLFLSPELLSLSSKVIISTSSNQDFSDHHITRIYGSKTAVFWDVAEVPLPVLLIRPDDIYEYIGFHLKAKGFDGEMSIWAYAEKIPFSDAELDTFRDIKLHFVPNVPGDKAARVLRMINDIELWKIDSLLVDLLKSPSVTVISNDIDGAISFNKCLRMKNEGSYKALLIQPKDLPPATDAVDLVAALHRRPSSLFEVGKMIEFTRKPKLWRMKKKKHKVKEEEQYPKHLLQKLRSETYSFTGVFWLVEQIPNCCDSISRIIKAAVKKMGYFDGVEIYAYGGEKSGSSQEEAKWRDSRIFYDPQGDKDIRVQRMLIEMIWFATNQANSYDDSKITKVMLIYKEALGDNVLRVLGALEARDFKVLLVRYDDEAELFRSENSMFESTRFLDGSRPTDWHSISPDDVFNCSNSSSSWETDNGTDDDDQHSDNSSDPTLKG